MSLFEAVELRTSTYILAPTPNSTVLTRIKMLSKYRTQLDLSPTVGSPHSSPHIKQILFMIKNGLLILFGNKIFLGLGTKSFKITTKGKMDILKIDFFF